MRKRSVVGLLASLLSAAIVVPVALAQVASVATQPPAAKKISHETTIHGRTLKDDYFW